VSPLTNTHSKQYVKDKDNTSGEETKRLQGWTCLLINRHFNNK
jgi:hypothetical protein